VLIAQTAPPGPASNPFGYLLETIDTYLKAFMDAGVAGLQGPVLATLFSVGGLYFALTGWMIMYGHIEGSITEVLKRVGKLALVYIVIRSSLFYGDWIVDFFWNIPEAIGQVLIKTATDITGDTLNPAADQINAGITELMKEYNTSVKSVTRKIAKSGTIVPDIVAVILNIMMQIPILAALFTVVIAKVGLSVMLVLGPLAFLSLVFGWSKAIFEGWLKQTMTFAITAVLAYTVIALLVSILNSFADDLLDGAGGSLEWINAIPLSLLAIICGIVFFQIPAFAGGLMGGIALGTGAAGAAAGGAVASLAGKGSRAAGGRLGRAIGRNASAGASKVAAKLPPRVQQQLKRGTVKGIRTAQKADYYTGGKNASKPKTKGSPKPEAPKAETPKPQTSEAQARAVSRARLTNIKPPDRKIKPRNRPKS